MEQFGRVAGLLEYSRPMETFNVVSLFQAKRVEMRLKAEKFSSTAHRSTVG